jgi:S1-C subfamily serine protease
MPADPYTYQKVARPPGRRPRRSGASPSICEHTGGSSAALRAVMQAGRSNRHRISAGRMHVIDFAIAIALVFSLVVGYRRGFWLTLAQYTGLVCGFLVGARFAPDIVDWFGITDPTGRQFAAIAVLVIAGSIGGSIGLGITEPLRRWLLTRRLLGTLDSIAGAGLATAVALVVVWFLTLVFARGPVPELAQALQQSTIVRRLDAATPQTPAFVTRVQQVLSGNFLPPVFTGLEPDLSNPAVPSPDAIDTEGVRAAAAATVRVQGIGCGGISSGSGFAVGNDLVVTNAHVVSGTTRITVAPSRGGVRAATVVAFDPRRDLAILRAPRLGLAGLTPGAARPGMTAAVIGYPGGGPQRISAAVIDRRFSARGRDIYGERAVVREIWSVSAPVRPGNSGGPVVDQEGRYLGAIFAASVSSPGHAFALVAEDITPAVQQAAGSPAEIDTRRFACAG